MKRISLRTKFVGAVIGLIGILGLAIIIFLHNIIREKFDIELQKRGLIFAKDIAIESSSAILTKDIFALQTIAMDRKETSEDIAYVFFLDSKGNVLAHTFGETFPVDLKKANAISSEQECSIRHLITERGVVLDIVVPVLKGEVAAARLGILEEPIRKEVANIMEMIIGGVIAILIFGSVLAIIFIGTITRPIAELTKVAETVGAGNFKQKVYVKSRDEIGRLGLVFNKMTEDLSAAMQKGKELAAVAAAAAETEKKRSEELRKACQELRDTQSMLVQSEKLSALGQLGGGVAHELNSPLAGVLSLVRSYKKEKDPKSEEYEDLKEMETACEHMAKIIKDFNAFTRQSIENLSELNFNEVIESTLSFSAMQLEKKDIKIEKDYEKNLPMVKANKSQLQQVIINMITNARDAMAEKGVFKITTRANESDQRKFVEIGFADTGSGISKEHIGKIFDPFFTTKRPGGGTGLGLSITHTIVKNHKGEILVNSEPEQGTTFTVRLPAVETST